MTESTHEEEVGKFLGNFTQQEATSDEGIEAAVRVLKSGRLHRYNVSDGEVGEAALLEKEFAAMMGARYCLAVASGGYAMSTALRAIGVMPGDQGAIHAVGAIPIYVDVTATLVIDLEDLEKKISTTDKDDKKRPKVLLLSHMRGHLCDMHALMEICDTHDITVIEDCAHTMGAKWDTMWSGRFGALGCYSTQTYKHINSGEGGLLITDNASYMAKAVMLSGSYMLYSKHGAAPPAEVFEKIKYDTPNISGRMDHLRAAILRPQLGKLGEKCEAWNIRYREVEKGLGNTPGLTLIERPEQEYFVGSSFQFLLKGWKGEDVEEMVKRCKDRGVDLKWFGAKEPVGFTSVYSSWKFSSPLPLPKSDDVLAGLLDMRIPLTFTPEDCRQIASIIHACVTYVHQTKLPSE